ncbi:hypothetical protein J7L81_02725 [Candidatus Aerophobetes bacterium]|nr:hypothetical protein [Candidatus Aerophobetes bacterium]
MRIAMMSAWNTDSGVAIHAEPIGKSWIKMGHSLTVFSFIKEDFHGEGFTGEDEDFVVRCFGTDFKTKYLNPIPFLTLDYDIFVVQDIGVLPKENLAKIFHLIKKKAPTIHIVHENTLSEDPAFYQFDWDAVVYFDKRQEFLKKIYTNAYYIPFPCFPIRTVEKNEARKKLDLPLNKKIVLFFCQRGYSLYLPERDRQLSDVLFLILGPKKMDILEKFSPDPNIIIREEKVLTKEKFDLYLSACDAVVLHKFQTKYEAVVSSTAFQALGTGCPLIVPRRSDFFHPFSKEVLRYADREELKHILALVLAEGEEEKKLKKEALSYAARYSGENIAREYLDLFERTKNLKS